MPYYAHTLKDKQPSEWEHLFTPFGAVDPDSPEKACGSRDGGECPHCKNLHPRHGHLNKVAWLTAQFAAAMFSEGKARESARQWGYLTGLWHDLGKFAPKWQDYLKSQPLHQLLESSLASGAEDLAVYGLTPEIVGEIQSTIADYEELIAAPAEAIASAARPPSPCGPPSTKRPRCSNSSIVSSSSSGVVMPVAASPRLGKKPASSATIGSRRSDDPAF